MTYLKLKLVLREPILLNPGSIGKFGKLEARLKRFPRHVSKRFYRRKTVLAGNTDLLRG